MTDRGYGRISLDTQRSGSIAKQRQRIASFATDDLVWYADESVSGSKIAFTDRPAGARLMGDLRPDDRVLVTKIDRAARSVRDLLGLVEMIEKRGASIVFVDANIDTSGSTGRFTLTLLGAIAELEAAIISERRKESLESFASEGRHAVGKAPFGFRSEENPGGRGLVIRLDPETSGLAREAIERIMAGESQESVRHSIGLSKTGMHSWLHNPRLAGMTPSGDGVVTIEGVPRVDPDAALLSLAEWQALRARLDKPEPKTWSRREAYGRALSCGVCGERMYVNVSKRQNMTTGATHDTYTCRKAKHAVGEGAPSIMVHGADAYMERIFLERFGDRRVVVASYTDSTGARMEAVSAAQVWLGEAQRRFSAAQSEDEETEAMQAQLDAKRALREAQELPEERIFSHALTGKTVAETWAESGTAERCQLLSKAGSWILRAGRGPVEDRIVLEPDDLLVELLTHPLGEAGIEDGFLLG